MGTLLTAIMVSLLFFVAVVGDILDPITTQMAAEGKIVRGLSRYTTLISLVTTAFSTGYLIVTTISLQEASRMALMSAHDELESAKRDLQLRHDRARLLSDLGARAAAATDFDQLKKLVLQALAEGMPGEEFEVGPVTPGSQSGITIGAGQRGLFPQTNAYS